MIKNLLHQDQTYLLKGKGQKVVLLKLIIGAAHDGVKTRSATKNECLYNNFLSQEEPKKVEDALQDPDWVLEMQEGTQSI